MRGRATSIALPEAGRTGKKFPLEVSRHTCASVAHKRFTARQDSVSEAVKTPLGGCGPLKSKSNFVAIRVGTLNDLSTVSVSRSEEHTSELQSLTNLVCRL